MMHAIPKELAPSQGRLTYAKLKVQKSHTKANVQLFQDFMW